jgi:GMP synthase (glutamine-hydrolysing)
LKYKKLYIVKTGTTFPDTAKRYGDFDDWTIKGIEQKDNEVSVIDIQNGTPLPSAKECSGVVVTGSHSYVTERLHWSEKIAEWIPSLIKAEVPFLGICYGHQLLAHALGGKVGFHPGGEEIGTVDIQLLPDCSADPIFYTLPHEFPVHVTHSQTVLSLPQRAVRLAGNAFETNHAFRYGRCAWGVQFHPEYNIDIMKSYILNQAADLKAAGRNPEEILTTVKETPESAEILKKFSQLTAGI